MNRPKYKELYLKEKNKKDNFISYFELLMDNLKFLNLISIDEIRVYDNHIYRTIEIKKGKDYRQIAFFWEEENE